MRRIGSALILSILTLVCPALAQDEPIRASETVQVNLVEIPVNVFDRSGQPVRGLKPENFEVLDDGKPRKIAYFEEIDIAAISADAEQVANPVARRLFLLLFDLTHSSPRNLLRAKEAAEAFVSGAVMERDLVALATFSAEDGVRILTAFTTERDPLRTAIRMMGSARYYQTNEPLLMPTEIAPGLVGYGQAIGTGFAQEALFEAQDIVKQATVHANDQFQRQRIERQLETFSDMARILDSVPGRKQVVLMSEGFDPRLVQGQTNTAEDQRQRTALGRGEIWRLDNEQRFGNVGTLRLLDEMTRMFRRTDVVLHAVDLQGVPASADPRTGSQASSSESLFLLSDATGGETFRNTNDLAEAFARMLKQQEVVYILGFQTTPRNQPGRFHDLAVKVKVVGHRGLRVSHRAGYFEPRLQMSAVEQKLSATDVLLNDIPYEEVDVRLLAAPFPAAGGNSWVPVIAEIDGGDLIERVTGERLNAEIFIYAFDERNAVRDFLFQTVSLDMSDLRETLGASGVKYYGTLSLPPGRYAIKSLVRVVESGFQGFRRVDVRVPERGEAAILPPLAFEEPGLWIMLKGAKTAEGQQDYPFMLLEESFIPSARPRFESGESYKLALFTWNLPPEEIELIARVEGMDGSHRNPHLQLLGRTNEPDDGVKLLFDFRPEGLVAGDYALHLSLRRRGEEREVRAMLPFQIAE